MLNGAMSSFKAAFRQTDKTVWLFSVFSRMLSCVLTCSLRLAPKEAEMLVIASPIYYHGLSGQLKCVIDRFYAAAYPNKPEELKKVAMFLSSGDPDMYDGALFSYQGDFLDYLKLEGMGVFTTNGYDPGVPEEKLEELREFGRSLERM